MIAILSVYIVLLVVGGVMGWLKAGSKVSLYTSVGFAIALAVCTFAPVQHGLTVALGLQGLLLAVFIARYAKTRKFMPSAFMALVTVVAVGLEWLMLRG